MIHSVHCSFVIEHPAFPPKLWTVRFQDTAVDIVAAPDSHREEGFALDVVDLTTQQVDHRGSNMPHFPAMPILDGKLRQQIEVLMVAGYKQGREGFRLQPVKPEPFFGAAVPYAAEVSGNHNAVVFC